MKKLLLLIFLTASVLAADQDLARWSYKFGSLDNKDLLIRPPEWIAITNQQGEYKIISSNYIFTYVFDNKTNQIVLAEQKTNVIAFHSPIPMNNWNVIQLKTNYYNNPDNYWGGYYGR